MTFQSACKTVGALLAASLFTLAVLPVNAHDGFSPYVDDKGAISFPAGFRTSMVHLGSWFVPDGDASGFHDVYTEAYPTLRSD